MYLSNCAIYQAPYATRHILALTSIRRNVWRRYTYSYYRVTPVRFRSSIIWKRTNRSRLASDSGSDNLYILIQLVLYLVSAWVYPNGEPNFVFNSTSWHEIQQQSVDNSFGSLLRPFNDSFKVVGSESNVPESLSELRDEWSRQTGRLCIDHDIPEALWHDAWEAFKYSPRGRLGNVSATPLCMAHPVFWLYSKRNADLLSHRSFSCQVTRIESSIMPAPLDHEQTDLFSDWAKSCRTPTCRRFCVFLRIETLPIWVAAIFQVRTGFSVWHLVWSMSTNQSNAFTIPQNLEWWKWGFCKMIDTDSDGIFLKSAKC